MLAARPKSSLGRLKLVYGDRSRYDDQPAPEPARCFDCPPVDPAPAVQWSGLRTVVCSRYGVALLVYFPYDSFAHETHAWALPRLRGMAKVSISSLVVVGVKEIRRS